MGKVGKRFKWIGSERAFIDEPDARKVKDLVLGRFGGNSCAGQGKNEDG